MKLTIYATMLTVLAAAPAAAQQAPKKQPATTAPAPKQPRAPQAAKPTAKPAAPAPAGIENAVTAALRVGYNKPASKMSGGFLPDLEAGYRIGLGSLAVEPALGFQRWNGDASGTVASPMLLDPAPYKQTASVMVIEGRARLWYDLGAAGYPLVGLGVGGVSADTAQESFGVKRSESGGALTWAAQLGYAYPVRPAYGNVELLVGYRGASIDFETAGDANLSGLQVLFGWHAAF